MVCRRARLTVCLFLKIYRRRGIVVETEMVDLHTGWGQIKGFFSEKFLTPAGETVSENANSKALFYECRRGARVLIVMIQPARPKCEACTVPGDRMVGPVTAHHGAVWRRRGGLEV